MTPRDGYSSAEYRELHAEKEALQDHRIVVVDPHTFESGACIVQTEGDYRDIAGHVHCGPDDAWPTHLLWSEWPECPQ